MKKYEYLLDLTPEGIKLNSVEDSSKSSLRELFEDAISRYNERKDEEELIEDTTSILEGRKNDIYLFVRKFLAEIDLDYKNKALIFNSYPICVDTTAKLVKVHYLFQMLGVEKLFVTERGKLIGKMRLETFLNFKYGKKQ